jgi:peptide/nickel transport system permease protein
MIRLQLARMLAVRVSTGSTACWVTSQTWLRPCAVGLSPRRAVLRHAVPNALLPVIALTAISLGYVVGGVIFIESVFSWPGIGQLTYDALLNRDLPVLQGVFLLSSAAVIFLNLVADLIIIALDPRVRAT